MLKRSRRNDSCSDEREGVRVLKSLGEQIVSKTGGEARSSDMRAISTVAKAFIMCLLEVEMCKICGERALAPTATVPFINRLC